MPDDRAPASNLLPAECTQAKPGQDVVYISSDLRRLAIWTLLRNLFVVVKRLTGFGASKNPVTLNPSWRKGGHDHVCQGELTMPATTILDMPASEQPTFRTSERQ